MHIAFVASEGVPFSKTGGLADVVGALPRALASLGHQVSVYLPRYRQTRLTDPQTVVRSITIPFDDRYRFCSVINAGNQPGIQFYFVDSPPYFDRDALYGTSSGDYPDNAERFALFSRAVLEASKILGAPHVFHCHDWQSALVPALLRTQYAEDPALRDVGTVFTIHNMGYQGLFPPDTLPLLTLPWDLFTISKMEFFGNVNFLKGALVYSDFITTVSRKYSQEIQTTEFGFGLEGVLRARSSTVNGILNGVDYRQWNPETDPYLPAKYSAKDRSGKQVCKQALQREFTLPEKKIPVLAMIARLTSQKGVDLVERIIPQLMELDLQLVILGKGDPTHEANLRKLQARYSDRMGLRIGFDEGLAHRIEGGADLFVMPSRYEPCGLSQLYSLRYGTVPVVRKTGGLADTVVPLTPLALRPGHATGFHVEEASADALLAVLSRAVTVYHERSIWDGLVEAGMNTDVSWVRSAQVYDRLFASLVGALHEGISPS